MDITSLPQDLKIHPSSKIQLFNYTSFQNIRKSKINLSRHTISFLKTGNKEVFGDGESKKIDNQSFLIMKSGNCLMSEKISNSNNLYQSILLFFDDDVVQDFIEKHSFDIDSKSESKSFYVFRYDDFITQFADSLEILAKQPIDLQNKLLKTKFEEIMLYLAEQNSPVFLNSIAQTANDRTIRLMNVVENNRINKLTLEELSFLCNMSQSTFKREFFKIYQTTPIKWFNDQRLNYIASLLRSNQKRPIDLYEDAGYEDFSNFIQAFKKKFGLTPKQYQNQN